MTIITALLKANTKVYNLKVGKIHANNLCSKDSKYRYGFNGKEKDDEAKGSGAQYDYGFRIYDPRVAKFLSVDPLTKSYPWYTPYQFAGNMPIAAIDLDGLEEYIIIRWYDDTKYNGSTFIRVPESERIKENGTLIINLHSESKPSNIQEVNSFLNLVFTNDPQGEKVFSGGKLVSESVNSWESGSLEGMDRNNTRIREYNIHDRVVEFKDASNTTTPTNPEVYDVFTRTLKDNPEFELTIEGNASKDDGVLEQENIRLSKKRANTVKENILSGGGSDSQIKATGVGSNNATSDGNPKDRSATIKTSIPKQEQYD